MLGARRPPAAAGAALAGAHAPTFGICALSQPGEQILYALGAALGILKAPLGVLRGRVSLLGRLVLRR